MLNQPTFEKLVHMRLSAMALAFRQQTEDPGIANLSFEERFGMLVDAEYWSRHNNRLKRNIHNACLEQPQASLADVNYTSGRLLDKALIQALGTGQYIHEQHNIIILGATGSGKTYLGCGSLQAGFYRKIRTAAGIAGGLGHCQRTWPLPEDKAPSRRALLS